MAEKIEKVKSTREVSSMIHSARPIVMPAVTIVFCCFVFLDLKSGDGVRRDVRTDNMCENNDPYRPWLWVGRVDQKELEGEEEELAITISCSKQRWKRENWKMRARPKCHWNWLATLITLLLLFLANHFTWSDSKVSLCCYGILERKPPCSKIWIDVHCAILYKHLCGTCE